MEPSSTLPRRAGALLTIIALTSLAVSEPAAARAFAGMGRAQPMRVVPRIPVQARISARHIVAPQSGFVRNRLHHSRFGTGAGFSGPYGYPYMIDSGTPDAALAAADFDPDLVPYDRPVCVRPLIIHIKPIRRPTDWPRVFYGRPPAC